VAIDALIDSNVLVAMLAEAHEHHGASLGLLSAVARSHRPSLSAAQRLDSHQRGRLRLRSLSRA
jgi:predicted nucleic acid-binding protein